MTRFILLLFIASLSASLSASQRPLTTLGEGHHAVTINQQQRQVVLIASERDGLVHADGQKRTSLLAGHFSQIDYRPLSRHEQLISVLDTNTLATRLLISDLASVREVLVLPAGAADTEAQCLGRIDDRLMLYRISAAGQLHQRAIVSDTSGTTAVAVRTVNIGPGIKACSVHDRSQTLYLADEFAGVWTMPAHQEAETQRELIVFSPDAAIEGVSISESGLLGWVSPDSSKLYLRDTQQDTDEGDNTIALDDNVAPETIHLDDTDSHVFVSVFDDNSTTIKQLSIEHSDKSAVTSTPSITALMPFAETTPVKRFGDAADDPAIWVNHARPESSLILGTDKKAGLFVYDLSGEQQQFLPVGRVNNVDVRYNWPLPDGSRVDIAAASNRTDNSISLFSIDRDTGRLTEVTRVATTLEDVYGLCMFESSKGIDIFINATDGEYQRYQLQNHQDGLTARLRDTFHLPSQPEGCVADDESNQLFMGEEATGIWLADLTDEVIRPRQIIEAADPVMPDIEGLALYTVDNQRYLIASSQGNNRYAIYQTHSPFALLGVFSIDANWVSGIDGASETDGLEVLSSALGSQLPHGLLVVQDGRNVMPTENQNFKLVDGRKLRSLIERLATTKQ